MNELTTYECKVILGLYRLQRPVSQKMLATELASNYQTVNSALKRLRHQDILTWESYGEVMLTAKGKQYGEDIIRHHHLFAMFLSKTLGLSSKEAHEQVGYTISKEVSCEIIDKISKIFSIESNSCSCSCGVHIPELCLHTN